MYFEEEPAPIEVPSMVPEPVLVEVPDPALVPAPIIATPRSTRNLIFRSGVGDPVAIATWPDIISDPIPAIDLVPAVDTEGVDRITILLAGGDAGPGRGGLPAPWARKAAPAGAKPAWGRQVGSK